MQALVRAAMANCVQRLRHEGSQAVCTLCRLCAGVSSDGAVTNAHTRTHTHTHTHTHCGRGIICLLKPQDTVERILSKILMGIGRGDRQESGTDTSRRVDSFSPYHPPNSPALQHKGGGGDAKTEEIMMKNEDSN